MFSLKVATLFLTAFVTGTNAFTVAPASSTRIRTTQLFALDAPVAPAAASHMNVNVAALSVNNLLTSTSPSNLPSHEELLNKVGSTITLASAVADPKTTNMVSGSGISIADIHYDGIVPRTEADEYVVISNSSRDPVDVSGYYIYPFTGSQGPTFYFPKGSVIKPNSSVRVYTNEIHKETGGYSWGCGKALWSNSGGLGILKDASGKKLGEFKYKPSSA